MSSFLALAHLVDGNAERARAVLDATPFNGDMLQTLPERRVAWARAELLLAEGAAKEALRLTERLLATTVGYSTSNVPPPLLVTKARALSSLGDFAGACDALTQAESSARAQGDLPWLWRAQCALSRAYSGAGRRADAEAAQGEARALLLRLAESIGADRREQFLAAAQAYVPQMRPPTARRATKEEWSGLTEREREVATHVTRGRSNREIAEALVLSERTVETHIGNILGKLGFASRSQIAVWGAARGLGPV